VLARNFAQTTGLGDIVGNGLFHVNVLALFHGPRGDHGMGMLDRGYHNRIYLTVHLVEHLAKVLELSDLGQGLERLGQTTPVGITNGDQILTHVTDEAEQIHAAPARTY
jgi:hypothetical protein